MRRVLASVRSRIIHFVFFARQHSNADADLDRPLKALYGDVRVGMATVVLVPCFPEGLARAAPLSGVFTALTWTGPG